MMAAEPAVAGYLAPPQETTFTGQIWNRNMTVSYCGVAHSQIGDLADQADGVAFTRPALFYILCAHESVTTGWRNWLGAQVEMLRDGSLCGSTAMIMNDAATAILGVGGVMCSNPPGWQEWRSVGTHMLFNDRTGGYLRGLTISPWAVY